MKGVKVHPDADMTEDGQVNINDVYSVVGLMK